MLKIALDTACSGKKVICRPSAECLEVDALSTPRTAKSRGSQIVVGWCSIALCKCAENAIIAGTCSAACCQT
eukprot:1145604-Pelagomonas_calceolata.AAC.4